MRVCTAAHARESRLLLDRRYRMLPYVAGRLAVATPLALSACLFRSYPLSISKFNSN